MPELNPLAAMRVAARDTPDSGGLPGDAPPFPVPDHTLIRRIGKGAYGEVWLARNTLGTWRAVKFIRRSSFDDDRPFERELAGIQRFEPISRSHESQLNILHVGRAGDGFYYVMELADDMGGAFASGGTSSASTIDSPHPLTPSLSPSGGEGGRRPGEGESASPLMTVAGINPDTYTPRNLRSELQLHGRLPAAECLRIGLALTTALEHLHKHGLVHRDIKPSNIVFVNGIPKLADIGLVARVEATISFVGTEGFLPPEGPGTRQADIFSLGKVLYEISTGHDRQQFPELPTNIVELPDRAVLSELNEVLLKACHRDPQERYQTAAEMHAELALLESGRSVLRLRGIERKLRFVQRAGAVVTVLAALAAGLYLWQAKQTRIVRDLAEANSRLARESRQRLIQNQTANGLRAMEANDPATAALWFAEVLGQAEADADLTRRQRFRLGALSRYLPQPAGLLRLDVPPGRVKINEATQRIVAGGLTEDAGVNTGEIKTWQASSGQPVGSVMLSNIWSVKMSPHGRWAVVAGPDSNLLHDTLDRARVATSLPFGKQGGQTAWAQDESKLAISPWTGREVQIVEIPSGRLLCPSLQLTHEVGCLSFDASGRQLVTGTRVPSSQDKESFSGQARVWDALTGEPITSWLEFDEPVSSAVFSPDGRALVCLGPATLSTDSALKQNLVRVFELPSGRLRFPPLEHRDTVLAAAFSPDGRILATASADRTVGLWDVLTGKAIGALVHDGYVRDLRFSPDGGWLAAVEQTQVRIWDVESRTQMTSPLKAADEVADIEFTPDGSRLLVTPWTGPILIWDLAGSLPALPPLASPSGQPVVAVHFSRSGQQLATVDKTGNVQLWEATSGRRIGRCFQGAKESPPAQVLKAGEAAWERPRAVWSADGRWIAAEGESFSVRVWSVANPDRAPLVFRHEKPVTCLDFSPVTHHLVTASADNTARVWDAITGQPVAPPLEHSQALAFARFSPDGRRIATADDRGMCFIWDATTGQRLVSLTSLDKPISAISFSPDGSRLVAGLDGDRRAVIWNTITGQMAVGPLSHQSTVGQVVFSPDGLRLLTASMDHTARLWDARTGQPATPPLQHASYVVACAFSPDGNKVVTASYDGTARIWDALTGEALTVPFRHQQPVVFAAFSPDGGSIATASLDGKARLWELPNPDGTAAEIKARAQVAAGGWVTPSGRVEPLGIPQLETAWRQIQARRPASLLATGEEAVRWHGFRLAVSEQAGDWFAADFHSKRLLALLPDDREVQEHRARVLAQMALSRERQAP